MRMMLLPLLLACLWGLASCAEDASDARDTTDQAPASDAGQGDARAAADAEAEPASPPAEPFASDAELNAWLFWHFEDPAPERTPEAIEFLAETDALISRRDGPAFVAFFSEMFRAHPERVERWVMDDLEGLAVLEPKPRAVVLEALWISDTEASRAVLASLAAEAGESERAVFERALSEEPESLLDQPVVSFPMLEILWAGLAASGDPAYLERIAGLLPLEESGDANQTMLAGAARFTLERNAARSESILLMLEQLIDDAPPAQRDFYLSAYDAAATLRDQMLESNGPGADEAPPE